MSDFVSLPDDETALWGGGQLMEQSSPSCDVRVLNMGERVEMARHRTRDFYACLRREVLEGNPALKTEEQEELRAHYPVMMSARQNPPDLAATIYTERRQYPVAAILETEEAVVLDAGCGYGSESFLFASLGARVVAVDNDGGKIRIARARQAFFEKVLGRALGVTFVTADLNEYAPEVENLTLTWVASVLAAIPEQADFLRRVYAATRGGGQVMVTDMNLWNPLFLVGEYRRRRRAAHVNGAFAREQDFGAMFARRGRVGARYLGEDGAVFDDVQFFQPNSLGRLFVSAGWEPTAFCFSGYVPPLLARLGLTALEPVLARAPIVSRMGYFYLGIGRKA